MALISNRGRLDPRSAGPEPLVLSISEVMAAAHISRTSIYRALNSGKLKARKRGRRTFVLLKDLHAWLDGFEPYEPRHEKR